MGRAKQIKERRKEARKVPVLVHGVTERWVVFGVGRYGDVIHEPAMGDGLQSKNEAERIAEGINRRGGNVDIQREVWNSSAAAFRVFREAN